MSRVWCKVSGFVMSYFKSRDGNLFLSGWKKGLVPWLRSLLTDLEKEILTSNFKIKLSVKVNVHACISKMNKGDVNKIIK